MCADFCIWLLRRRAPLSQGRHAMGLRWPRCWCCRLNGQGCLRAVRAAATAAAAAAAAAAVTFRGVQFTVLVF